MWTSPKSTDVHVDPFNKQVSYLLTLYCNTFKHTVMNSSLSSEFMFRERVILYYNMTMDLIVLNGCARETHLFQSWVKEDVRESGFKEGN